MSNQERHNDIFVSTPRKTRSGLGHGKKHVSVGKTQMMKASAKIFNALLAKIPKIPTKRRSGQSEDKERKAAGGPYNVELKANKYTVNLNCTEDVDINIQIRHNLPPKVTTTVPKEDEEMVAAKILMDMKKGSIPKRVDGATVIV